MASMWENMKNGATSSVEDASTSTCHVSTVLKSLCQMLKHMKYHIYQPHLIPNYTFLLSIYPVFSSFFARAYQRTDFCCTLYIRLMIGQTIKKSINGGKKIIFWLICEMKIIDYFLIDRKNNRLIVHHWFCRDWFCWVFVLRLLSF